MTRYPFIICIMLLLLGLPAWAQDADGDCLPAAGTPIRIGAVFPSVSLFTQEANEPYQGAAAMIEAVNACGGIDGRPVEFIYIPANNREAARAAVETLRGDVGLVIGSGSLAVSEVLLEASADGSFVYWEVSEMLNSRHEWAFSPLLGSYPFGTKVADFINNEIVDVLDGDIPQVALIHETRPRAALIAEGLTDSLIVPPLIERAYQNQLRGSYDLAVDMREAGVNTVVVVAFDDDTDQLWYDMREANANVKAWIQVDGENFRRSTCDRLGNTGGLISIGLKGEVDGEYRLNMIGMLYDRYTVFYQEHFGRAPGEYADLAASSTYMLLRHVLPNVEDDRSTESIRAAVLSTEVETSSGMMGEGLSIQAGTGENADGVAIVQQRQNNHFCTLLPSAVATCADSLQPFPTWRERVTSPQYATCNSD